MFRLAHQAGKVLHKPFIPMLRENNVRTGFFEWDQFSAVRARLPKEIRPVVSFRYITGWRIASAALPLQWRNVDFRSGEVRLDPGVTKNGEACSRDRQSPWTTIWAILTMRPVGSSPLRTRLRPQCYPCLRNEPWDFGGAVRI